mmetsp:Transcript_10619/g.17391  ORF Transcript_10619/g.17391 Transcript_10619/m.17391 type:complete len:403 (+) Transcript_10619:118-1326(+)
MSIKKFIAEAGNAEFSTATMWPEGPQPFIITLDNQPKGSQGELVEATSKDARYTPSAVSFSSGRSSPIKSPKAVVHPTTSSSSLNSFSGQSKVTVPKVARKEVYVKSLLARGGTSDVFNAVYNGKSVVAKMPEQSLLQKEGAVDFFTTEYKREAHYLSLFDFHGIIRCEGFCNDTDVPFLLLEKAHGLTLTNLVKTRSIRLTLLDKLSLALSLAEALREMHDIDVCHRDLKAHNIMIDMRTLTLKLVDFGLAKRMHTQAHMTPRTGSHRWASPENLRGEPYDLSTDIYSYGILLWQLVTRRDPYAGMDAEHVGKLVAFEGIRPLSLQASSKCPQELCDLIHACWAEEPASRPTIHTVIHKLERLKINFGLVTEKKSNDPSESFSQRLRRSFVEFFQTRFADQ